MTEVLTITRDNALSFLIKYIEVGNAKGFYKEFNEAFLYKRSIDTLVNSNQDMTANEAKDNIEMGLKKVQGDSANPYSLTDSSVIALALIVLGNKIDETKVEEPIVSDTKVEEPTVVPEEVSSLERVEFDISELSEDVPLNL